MAELNSIGGINYDPDWQEKEEAVKPSKASVEEVVEPRGELNSIGGVNYDPDWQKKEDDAEYIKQAPARKKKLEEQSVFQDAMDFIKSPIDQTGEIIDYGAAELSSVGSSLVAGAVDWADNQLESEDRSQSRFTLQKARNSIKASEKAGEGLSNSQKFLGETIGELPSMGAAFIPIVGVPLSLAMSAVQSFGSVAKDQVAQGKNLDITRGGEAFLGELVGDFIARKLPFLKFVILSIRNS